MPPTALPEARFASAECLSAWPAEISDPDGWVWTMLSAMDGSRGLPELIEHVRAAHPAQSPEVLRHGALQLLRTGYVEDVGGTRTRRAHRA